MTTVEGRVGETPARPFSLDAVDCRALVPDELVAGRADRYLTISCPVHDDHSPSCLVYADGWNCRACGASGRVLDLYTALHGGSRAAAFARVEAGVASGEYAPRATADVAVARHVARPPQGLGRRLHLALTDEALAYYLFERGLTPDTVAAYQLGWGALYDDGPEGYTVPVYRAGELRQIKQRLPGLEKSKYRSVADCGSYLYLGEDLAWGERVLLAGGEFDAIAARQHGYVAAAPTSGEARFDPAWRRDLRGTTPYCAFDMDERGEDGYRRLRHTLAGNLKRVRFPEKDLTEFFLRHDPAELAGLLDEADERFALGG